MKVLDAGAYNIILQLFKSLHGPMSRLGFVLRPNPPDHLSIFCINQDSKDRNVRWRNSKVHIHSTLTLLMIDATFSSDRSRTCTRDSYFRGSALIACLRRKSKGSSCVLFRNQGFVRNGRLVSTDMAPICCPSSRYPLVVVGEFESLFPFREMLIDKG